MRNHLVGLREQRCYFGVIFYNILNQRSKFFLVQREMGIEPPTSREELN